MSDDDEQSEPTEVPEAPDVDTRDDPTEFLPIRQALAKVMGEVQWIGKGGEFKEGTGQERRVKYRFRGVDQVVNAVGPMLRRYGVLVIPEAIEHRMEQVTTRNNAHMANVVVKMGYTLRSLVDGDEMIVGSAWGEGFDSGDKATAKAESVAYRVFWLQALAIPTDEPDPDSQNYERGSADQAPPPPASSRRSSGRQRPAQQQSDKVSEGQANTMRDAIARIMPESYRATVLAEFKETFGITKAAEMPRARYTEASRWIQEHTTPPDDAQDAPSDPEGDQGPEAADGATAAEGPSFTEVREWLEARTDARKFVQTRLAQLGKPATGRTSDLLDTLAAEWARRGGVPDEWKDTP